MSGEALSARFKPPPATPIAYLGTLRLAHTAMLRRLKNSFVAYKVGYNDALFARRFQHDVRVRRQYRSGMNVIIAAASRGRHRALKGSDVNPQARPSPAEASPYAISEIKRKG
jgi:hypothetical protein